MDRRLFLGLTGAAALAPMAAFAAEDWMTYEKGMVKKLLADGKTVFVDFSATWCSTCKSQERTISALRKSNSAYDDAMVFVRVDWDEFGSSAISKKYKIPRRSTLLVLKGREELGRIVAGTRKGDIQNLLDLGVAAA